MNLELVALVSLALAAIPAALFLVNLLFYRRTAPVASEFSAGSTEALSVLIPARNEERNIRAMLEAVLANRGADFEIIVLDDHSTDRTAVIVETFVRRDPRVRLESAPSLPPGWCGKQHACSVLARLARNPLLVFIDADVRLKTASQIPQRVELSDQYETLHVLTFPTTNVTFLTIADRKGSEQIAGWVSAVKARPATPVDIHGLADVGGVPGFLRGRIRKRFQETIPYPVMMDWSGKVCAQFKYVPDRANVFIIDRNGSLVGHFSGKTNAASLKEAFVALDKALATPVNPPTNVLVKKLGDAGTYSSP